MCFWPSSPDFGRVAQKGEFVIRWHVCRTKFSTHEVSHENCSEISPEFFEPLLCPEGPARHLDASRQKLTPHCLAAIFDSQLPSPKLSLKMPPKMPLPHNRGHFFLFQNCPRGGVIARQLSGKNCLAAIFASRHQDASPGPLGGGPKKKTRKIPRKKFPPKNDKQKSHRRASAGALGEEFCYFPLFLWICLAGGFPHPVRKK